jgi:hypothetical protein
VLTCGLDVPDAADTIWVTADLGRRTVAFSVDLKAPDDRKSTSARVNWVTRQLAKSDPENIHIMATFRGKAGPTQKSLAELREDPTLLQTENQSLAPVWFNVRYVAELGPKFSGPEKFIAELESSLIIFYDQVVANLKAYQPSAPQPVKERKNADETAESSDLIDGEVVAAIGASDEG